MKRALFDTVTVLPFASGNVVDRTGYESAVLAVTVEASQTANIKVETADSTAGPYEPVKDSRIFVDNPVLLSVGIWLETLYGMPRKLPAFISSR